MVASDEKKSVTLGVSCSYARKIRLGGAGAVWQGGSTSPTGGRGFGRAAQTIASFDFSIMRPGIYCRRRGNPHGRFQSASGPQEPRRGTIRSCRARSALQPALHRNTACPRWVTQSSREPPARMAKEKQCHNDPSSRTQTTPPQVPDEGPPWPRRLQWPRRPSSGRRGRSSMRLAEHMAVERHLPRVRARLTPRRSTT